MWSAALLPGEEEEGRFSPSGRAEMRSCRAERVVEAESERRANSAATRDWMCSSRSLARVLSV